tara:strand:+ start:116 stop:1483 length:1368 start_codon:yes stop_codon:yes gene_type:complete
MNRPKIEQKTDQSLSLSPQHLINANILQLNSAMLEVRLYKELESNPALEIIESESDIDNDKTDEEDNQEEIDFEDEENQNWGEIKPQKSNEDIISNLTNSTTITEQVISSLRDDNLSDHELKIAEQIAGNLDDQGYLKIDPELISDKLNISKDSVGSVIEKIKSSKFPGLASSNIKDCLLAQLNVYNISPLATNILSNYFDDFMNKRYDKIMGLIKCNKDEFNDALIIISQLNPNPRSMIDEADYKKNTIIPDVIIDKINDKWNIIINDGTCPNLIVSDNYLKMYNDKNQGKDVRFFLKSKIQSAKWLIEAIESRNKTIQQIMACIITKQDLYFNSDKQELNPMILKDIANELDLDISTISRATNGKYVQMPWGIKELKFFFSESIASDKGAISSKNVKKKLKDIIDSENKENPLGDQDLTDLLNNDGIKISRRTVAKYRDELNYSVARLRKEFK